MPHAPRELLLTVRPWVREYVEFAYPDDDVSWGVSLQMLPDPSQDDAWVPVVGIYVELPVVDKNSLYAVLMLPPFQMDQEQVRAELKAALDDLEARRAVFRELPERGDRG